MTKTIVLILLIAGIFTAGSLATNEAYAAVDMFLKIDGIEGESTDAGHEGEIEIDSWTWGVTNQPKKHGGGGAGKVSVQDLSFIRSFDKSSPKLMQACADGTPIPEVVLTLTNSRHDVEYLKITLTEVLISSYQTATDNENTVPVEEVSLSFAKIKYEYQQRDRDGLPIDDPVTGEASSKHGRK